MTDKQANIMLATIKIVGYVACAAWLVYILTRQH